MTLELIQKLQTHPDRIRNFTICAHIDHGKTSLTDSLLASNGLLNAAQVGQIKQLDYLALEQERCITIKSALVSLVHVSYRLQKPFATLFHLFDSPGHCDFASEVLQSFSLSDSAVLLVDVIEGVSSQTEVIINELKQLKLKAVLGINKVDRLFEELHLTPDLVFARILEIIAEVNRAFGKNRFDFSTNVFISCSLHGWALDSYRAAQVVKLLCKEAESVELEKLQQLISLPNTVLTENGFKEGSGASVMSMVLEIIESAYSGDVKMIKKFIKKTKLNTNGKDDEICINFLKDLFPLSPVVFDEILTNTGDKENLYIQELNKQQGLDSLLVCTKMLKRNEVDVQVKINGSLVICRVEKTFENDVLEVDTPFYDQDGREIRILNVFQPMGKALLPTAQTEFCSGCIIVVECNVMIRPGSLLFQQFGEVVATEPDYLSSFAVKSSETEKRALLPAPDFVQQIRENLVRLREKILKFEKPLITVCLNPELLSQYNDFVDVLQTYCDCDPSSAFTVSDMGELMLSVCGDVHLDLCVDNIQKEAPNIEFTINDSNFKVCEVVVDEESPLPLKPMEKLDEMLLEVEEQIFAFLNTENQDPQRILMFLRNLPQIPRRDTFQLHYFSKVGEILDFLTPRAAGLEISVIRDICGNTVTCTRYQLLACAGSSLHDFQGDTLLEDPSDNVRFLVNGEMPSVLEELLRHAFRANMRHGPICLEHIEDTCICVRLIRQEIVAGELNDPRSLPALVRSLYPGHYVSMRQTISACYEDALQLIRASLQLAALRIKEPHLRTTIECPKEQGSQVLELLEQFQCEDIALPSFSATHAGISCLIPLRHALKFSRELRQTSSGRAAAEFAGLTGVVLSDDPRKDYAGDADEEIEWGYEGRGNNLAAQVVLAIELGKGLIVEDVVKDAEKERTIKKCR